MGADVDALIVIVPLSALPFSSCCSRRPGARVSTGLRWFQDTAVYQL